jgi:1,4-dihydroxy-6-naphthoate synthase
MQDRPFTLGHSPDPDDAFMFYGLARDLIPTHGFRFEHILQDIQTLNERATRGELDITAISIHAYAYVCDQYALLPSGASMGDGYGPMLVGKKKMTQDEILRSRIAVPGTMTSAFLALQLWLGKSAAEFNYVVVPFDEIFRAVRGGQADVGLIIHEGQLTYQNEGLQVSADFGVWWGEENDGLPLPLGGNVIHKRHTPAVRKAVSDVLTSSIQFSLDHRPEAVHHALQYARDMGRDLADKFVGLRREGQGEHSPFPAPGSRTQADPARSRAGVRGLTQQRFYKRQIGRDSHLRVWLFAFHEPYGLSD